MDNSIKPELLNSNLDGLHEVEELGVSEKQIREITSYIVNDKKFNYDCFDENSLENMITNYFKGKVFPSIFGKKEYSGEMARKGKIFEIGLPVYAFSITRRFTIAHELGHFILHSVMQDDRPIFAKRGAKNVAEEEANVFARNLLMPEEQFKNTLKNNNNDIYETSIDFLVSTKVARLQADSLGLKYK